MVRGSEMVGGSEMEGMKRGGTTRTWQDKAVGDEAGSKRRCEATRRESAAGAERRGESVDGAVRHRARSKAVQGVGRCETCCACLWRRKCRRRAGRAGSAATDNGGAATDALRGDRLRGESTWRGNALGRLAQAELEALGRNVPQLGGLARHATGDA